ncbi:hypothetical protein SAMD00019534_116760 [Acytostelium subglobosum LB1]|uniref:hypothetical protein n=1 Tax=Acytostelium subglobosum LB1 TaxID=1410327 RepID=UPI000644D6F8|nr:hypothetical protein SAMD00019534_116760 [Acytostelium subglobosum LB1]GAM28500.1 hypothetical protein SAMD00019534_116760 [Acytostelium subglobosum LB1]|eukprot:XP_012748539.1 hypothetical protein SAMD00019534_116760 [Acytostelium subglobosum LB1]
MMTNLTTLHLQPSKSSRLNIGMIRQLRQFYAGTLTLNTLVLHVTTVNVIHLMPHCRTTPIKSLTLAFTDIDQLTFLFALGKLDDLFGAMATHLQQTMIKQLEYLTIYIIKESNSAIIPFNIQCLSALITSLQLHCINDRYPINYYRLVS